MEEITKSENNIVVSINNQKSNYITKKLILKKETLKKLVLLATNEYFDEDTKIDDKISKILDSAIDLYFKQKFIKEIESEFKTHEKL